MLFRASGLRALIPYVMGAGMLCGTPAWTQDAPSAGDAEEATQLGEIIVTGRRLEDAVQAYVESLSAPARMRGLARWSGEICPDVVNLEAVAASEVTGRITDVATAVGLTIGAEGCEPNLVVIGAEDGRVLADAMVDRFRRQFFRFASTSSNRGTQALEAFRSTTAPVRWWHVSLPVHAVTGEPMVRLPGERPVSPPCYSRATGTADLTVAGLGGSRTGATCNAVTDRIIGLWIVVDVNAAEGLSWAQLSDYLAFVAMAQVEPDGDLSAFDTVLNLFDDPKGVTGITAWDETYLTALYAGRSERIDLSEQRARMVEAMSDAPRPSTRTP